MAATTLPTPLVDAEWLLQHLGEANLVVLDASWYLPALNRIGAQEYAAGHIPEAAFFDIDEVADRATPLPHMLPSPERFAAAVGAMGVGDDSSVVVYDGIGLYSAPRLWWMFLVFGHTQVAVLDGGLPAWRQAGGRVDASAPLVRPQSFTPQLNSGLVAGLEDMRSAVAARTAQVLDARPHARFLGAAPEPRPGLRPGHMPGARSLPASEIGRDGRLKSADELTVLFQAAGVDFDSAVITTCGSGVSAAVLTLALAVIGKPIGRLYDGSWSEWGACDDLPVATAP